MYKRIVKYFAKHPAYNAIVHALGGAGVGILLTHTYVDPHPLRWGAVLLVLAIFGHLYPLTSKK